MALALCGVLNAPALTSPLAADDYAHRAIVTGAYPVPRSKFEAYSAVKDAGEVPVLVDAGILPWWAAADSKGVALRPGGSALLAADHALGLGAAGQRIHSFAWLGLALLAFAWLARLLLPRPAATAAVLLFAVSPVHVIPIAWAANRAALVSMVFALAAIAAHVKWRRDGWAPGSAIVVAAGAASLLVSEYGLGTFAFLFAHELSGDRARKSKIAGGATVLGALAAYLALRLLWGAGVSASDMYADPLTEPGRFLEHLTARWPAMIWHLGAQLPCEASAALLEARPDPAKWSCALPCSSTRPTSPTWRGHPRASSSSPRLESGRP